MTLLRHLCCLWIVVILGLVFQPAPTRAQPDGTRTAMKPIAEDASGPVETAPLPTGVGSTKGMATPAPRLLVLKNGRIVDGRISQNGGGYLVEKPNGSLLVPFDRVSFEASDKHDAYRKMRSTMPADAITSNIAMARWCISYSLFDDAENELRIALQKEPRHAEARSILERLEELRNPSQPLHRATPKSEARTDEGFQLPDVESLGGFSRATVQEFVSRVQPILWNKCGNASCHGGTPVQGGFSLSPVRSGRGNRVLAERNLAAVLKEIDPETPDRSPLLTVPRGSHGGMKSIFAGVKGGEQYDMLREWTRAAAKEWKESGLAAASSARIRATASARVRTERERDADEEVGAEATEEGVVPAASASRHAPRITGRVTPAAHEPRDPIQRVLQESQPDAFDPDEFNRQGRNASP